VSDSPASDFVSSFRASAPYVHAHRGRTFVVLVGGELLQGPGLVPFVHDLALLHGLGVRIVLVVGARPQIDARLAERGLEPRYAEGLRITDPAAMACVKEAAGVARVELEALFSMGLPDSPMEGARLRVASGNFVTARPVGVKAGVDHLYTGSVRRVDAAAIAGRLDAGELVLAGPVGYSLTGEAFNVSTHDVAVAIASALRADKFVSLVEAKRLPKVSGRFRELSLLEARARLERGSQLGADVRNQLETAVACLGGGVARAHLVPRRLDGGILRELFTRDGAGLMITRESFEDLRPARLDDVLGMLSLIEPLAAQGLLLRRPRELLEMDIDRFTVATRDGLVVACAALYPHPEDGSAEIACLAVREGYQGDGRADALLGYLERQCVDAKLDRLFALTTEAQHWFLERGFRPGRLEDLPVSRRKSTDRRRRSKVLIKAL